MPQQEHPETTYSPDESEVHANHVEAFNIAVLTRMKYRSVAQAY
jgi:hypothetical protein